MSASNFFLHSSKFVSLRYKVRKLYSLFPSKQKKILSNYEDKGYRKKLYKELWQNAAKALGYTYQSIGYGYWIIKNDTGRFVRGNTTSIELDTSISAILAGNKPLVHTLNHGIEGYQTAKFTEFDLYSIQPAFDFLKNANGPCVVKPAQDTGAGSGVTMNISSENDLVNAAINASIWSKNLMIEETIAGQSYRLLILDNKYLGAIRRDPPFVIGDGKTTIGMLIDKENIRRSQSSNIVSLFPLIVDQECINSLHSQGYTLSSVPSSGQKVVVKNVINQNSSDQNHDVSEQVHPDIIKTSLAASKNLGLLLSGVDVITKDITQPLSISGGIINEINSNPGLHHHYLVSSPQKNKLLEKIIEYCMKNNKTAKDYAE